MNKITLGTTAAAAALGPVALGALALGAVALGAVAALTLSDLLAPKHGIILRATNADITPDQWRDIKMNVLNKIPSVTHDADGREMLYRVREFKSGLPVGDPLPANDDGKLPETQLLEEREKTVADLQAANFTGHAFQIGVGAIERSKRIPRNGTETLHAHYRPNIIESREMVKEVDAILR